MARSKKHHSKKGFTLPLAVVAGFAPLAINTYNVSGGGPARMGWMVTQAITGYDTDTRKFWMGNLNKGLIPIAIGVIVHKIAGKLGINRAIAGAGIPFIRV